MVYDKTITNDENDGARPIKCTFGDAMPLSDKNGAQGRGQRKSGFSRFVSDVFVGADSGAETRTETRHEKMEYFLCSSEIFAVS